MRKMIFLIFSFFFFLDNAGMKIVLAQEVSGEAIFQALPEEEIKKTIREQIFSTLPYENINIREMKISGGQNIPPGDLSYEVLFPRREINLRGKTNVPVKLFLDGKEYKKILVTVNLEILQEAFIAQKPNSSGHIMSKDDVYRESRTLTDLPSDYVREMENLVGKRLKIGIRPGTLLTSAMLEEAPLIKKGEKVMIVAESDSLRIVTPGRAKESGLKGETIKIENINSKKTIYARVIGQNLVEVDF